MTNNFNPSAQLKAQGYIADEIVTGEAVVLELPAATSFSRLVSGGIDFLFYALLLIGTVNLMPGFDLFNAPLSKSMLILLLSFKPWFFYFFFCCWITSRRATRHRHQHWHRFMEYFYPLMDEFW